MNHRARLGLARQGWGPHLGRRRRRVRRASCRRSAVSAQSRHVSVAAGRQFSGRSGLCGSSLAMLNRDSARKGQHTRSPSQGVLCRSRSSRATLAMTACGNDMPCVAKLSPAAATDCLTSGGLSTGPSARLLLCFLAMVLDHKGSVRYLPRTDGFTSSTAATVGLPLCTTWLTHKQQGESQLPLLKLLTQQLGLGFVLLACPEPLPRPCLSRIAGHGSLGARSERGSMQLTMPTCMRPSPAGTTGRSTAQQGEVTPRRVVHHAAQRQRSSWTHATSLPACRRSDRVATRAAGRDEQPAPAVIMGQGSPVITPRRGLSAP